MPAVLADQQAGRDAVDVDDAGRLPGVEIALLVEHGVVGKPLLAVDRDDPTVAQHGQRVVASARGEFGKAHDDGAAAHLARKRRELARAGVEERRPQHQVLGRVPAQRKLRRDDQPRAGTLAFGHGRQDRPRIAGKVADDLIQLRDGDLHGKKW